MLYTGCKFDQYEGIAIEVTAHAKHFLAPDWALIKAYKEQRITWAQYEAEYVAQLRTLYRVKRSEFLMCVLGIAAEAAVSSVTIVCFERGDETTVLCHRRILAGVIRKVAARNGYVI